MDTLNIYSNFRRPSKAVDPRTSRASQEPKDLWWFRGRNRHVRRPPTDLTAYEADVNSGPVISPQAKERIEAAIASVETQGGKILLDGRGCSVAEYPDGNFVGPTIVEVTTDMDAYKWVLNSLLCVKLMTGMKSLDRS